MADRDAFAALLEQKKPKAKRLCSFSSSWTQQEFEIVLDNGEKRSFSGSVLLGQPQDGRVFCKLCKMSFSIAHGGAYAVRRHFKSSSHNAALSSARKSLRLDSFGFGQTAAAKIARQKQEEQKKKVLCAEAQFIQFVAEHNLPFRCGDHFTKLVKVMFPDSDIARQFQCSRTKTSVLVRYGNSKVCQEEMMTMLGNGDVFYSLMIDESND